MDNIKNKNSKLESQKSSAPHVKVHNMLVCYLKNNSSACFDYINKYGLKPVLNLVKIQKM